LYNAVSHGGARSEGTLKRQNEMLKRRSCKGHVSQLETMHVFALGVQKKEA
jgi:hypothetical protein